MELLTSLYNLVNENLFNSELPSIPVEATAGSHFAGCTKTEQGQIKQIVINTDYLQGTDAEERFKKLLATLLHEMVHVYCITKGIPHYENGKHLQGFIAAAEKHGLIYDDFANTNFLTLDVEEILRKYQ